MELRKRSFSERRLACAGITFLPIRGNPKGDIVSNAGGNVPDFCFPDRLFYLAESWDGICALRRGGTAVPDFSAAGLVIGIMAKLEEDKFYLFAWIGIVLNALTLLGIGGIVAVGVYGL